MYEQYDGIKKYKGAFSPHPEMLDVYEDMKFFPQEEKPAINIITNTPEENGCNRISKEKEPEKEKEEKGLTVTNGVSYEVTTEDKKKRFGRR